MQWFGGCAAGRTRVHPAGADLVWRDPPLWTVGPWQPRRVRTLNGPGVGLAVLGSCAASDQELACGLHVADLAALGGAWAGSYTLVRHRMSGTLEVVTDAAGACPIYTVHTAGGTMVWGSSALALSGLAGGHVDTEWLASYLLDKQRPRPDRSAWTGVVPVPPGHRLLVDAGGAVSVEERWSPVTRSYDEAVLLVRESLAEGVRARVAQASTSADLAGTDSTTLAVMAAQHGPVTAVTVHPKGVTEGGDLDYARALDVSGLCRREFPLEDHQLPFSPCDIPLPATDEPPPSTASWAMFSAQLRFVISLGSECHLTGDGGDNLFLPPPTHLADLARRGRLLHLLSDAHAWARLRRGSPWPILQAAVKRDAPRLARPWITRPAWLTTHPEDPEQPVARGNADEVLVADIRGAARPANADIQLAQTLGVELHNPYFDAAVLNAVISAPSWQRFSTRRYKPLLNDAVATLLPTAHRNRTGKGVFTGDFHRGLRANLNSLLALADGHLAGFRLIDPVPLRAALHAAALGATTNWAALLPTLGAEMWLNAVDQAPATAWTNRMEARCE